jgi:hypothetical protein
MAENGLARRQFAREVENRKDELMRRDRDLPELEAFLRAANKVCCEMPQLLAAYRKDAQHI